MYLESIYQDRRPFGRCLCLDAYVSGSEDGMAYRYSVNGAPFGLWKNRTEINLYGLRAGDHEVTVCSRNAMMVVDTDCDVVNVTTN